MWVPGTRTSMGDMAAKRTDLILALMEVVVV